MSIQDTRRKAFEEWARNERYDVSHQGAEGQYIGHATAIAWEAWNAALDSVAMKLPSPYDHKYELGAYGESVDIRAYMDDLRQAIKAHGLKPI